MARKVENPATQKTCVRSLGQDDPLEKGMATHFTTLCGESHGQRILAGYSPRGYKESDTTERLRTCNRRELLMNIRISGIERASTSVAKKCK